MGHTHECQNANHHNYHDYSFCTCVWWWIGISLLIRDCKFCQHCLVQWIGQGHCPPTWTCCLIAQILNLNQNDQIETPNIQFDIQHNGNQIMHQRIHCLNLNQCQVEGQQWQWQHCCLHAPPMLLMLPLVLPPPPTPPLPMPLPLLLPPPPPMSPPLMANADAAAATPTATDATTNMCHWAMPLPTLRPMPRLMPRHHYCHCQHSCWHRREERKCPWVTLAHCLICHKGKWGTGPCLINQNQKDQQNKGLRQWVAQWTLLVVQVKGPLVVILFVASWIGTGECHVVGSSCVFLWLRLTWAQHSS